MATPPSPPVIIVGAGLAGLSCAVHLHAAGIESLVLEASDDIGGRVRTDHVDGFLLDRGFQVLLTAYPEARAILDLDALDLRPFEPGALIRQSGRFHRLGDPFRRPGAALGSLRSPVGTLADKLRVGLLRMRCTAGGLDRQLGGDDLDTLTYLRQRGLTPGMIEGFFRPFLGGVFLEPDLATTSRMFRFVFRMFAQGDAVVPARGMGEISLQLARRLPAGTIRTSSAVAAVAADQIVLEGGEVVAADGVVVATDGAAASRLVPGMPAPAWNGVTCLYFVADRAPIAEPILILDGEGPGPINNCCFPTQVSPAYGPPDRALVSVSALGEPADAGDLEERVHAQLVDWFGDAARAWKHLRTYHIARALPAQPPGWLDPPRRPARHATGLYLAGDHLDTASTNGALAAGRRAAEAVIADRQVSG